MTMARLSNAARLLLIAALLAYALAAVFALVWTAAGQAEAQDGDAFWRVTAEPVDWLAS